jgi:uncharacterized BrkB/YihY/UPF0761 family membrane protein
LIYKFFVKSKKIKRVNNTEFRMKSEIIEKMLTVIGSAFGLVAALAWNSAIQSVFSKYYQQPGEGVTSQIIYAITVTIIAVLAVIWTSWAYERAKKREKLLRKHVEMLKKKGQATLDSTRKK